MAVRSDSYLGADVSQDIKLDVHEARDVPDEHPQWEFEDEDEDENSKAEESDDEFATDDDFDDDDDDEWKKKNPATFNLFVTRKNENTNSPIHEFKVLPKGQRAF